MTGLGVIGTAAAWLNYRKAKQELDALKEKRDEVNASVLSLWGQNTYYDVTNSIETKANDMPEGVEYAAMLRVGNVVGKMFKARVSLTLTNTGKNTYYIKNTIVDTFFDNLPVTIYKTGWVGTQKVQSNTAVDKYLKPNGTITIEYESGISGLPDEQMKKMRELICAVAGTSPVTNILKPVNIIDGIKSDIWVNWGLVGDDAKEEVVKDGWNTLKSGYTLKKYGVLRYMKETSSLDE